MAIDLKDLVRLRGDKGSFARLEELIGKRAAAEKAAYAAHVDLAKATADLKSLGIVVDDASGGGGGGGRGKYGRRRGRPPKSASGSGGAAKPMKRGPKPGGARRSGEDYAKALDEVGAEFANVGKADITGPDIAAAMKKRGFKSKPVVMNQARAHANWKMKGVKRGARYFYKG